MHSFIQSLTHSIMFIYSSMKEYPPSIVTRHGHGFQYHEDTPTRVPPFRNKRPGRGQESMHGGCGVLVHLSVAKQVVLVRSVMRLVLLLLGHRPLSDSGTIRNEQGQEKRLESISMTGRIQQVTCIWIGLIRSHPRCDFVKPPLMHSIRLRMHPPLCHAMGHAYQNRRESQSGQVVFAQDNVGVGRCMDGTRVQGSHQRPNMSPDVFLNLLNMFNKMLAKQTLPGRPFHRIMPESVTQGIERQAIVVVLVVVLQTRSVIRVRPAVG